MKKSSGAKISFESPLERAPLAERLRPASWEDLPPETIRDEHLRRRISSGVGAPPSLILWGPPGCGKTTIGRLIGKSFDCHFVEFSAVLSGVKEVRDVVAAAEGAPRPTLLFVDEIHRFNKAQQDAFLPHVERGTISLVGATTENPSFSLTSALLSRCRVVVIPPHSVPSLLHILRRGCALASIELQASSLELVAKAASGDARRAIGFLDRIVAECDATGRAASEIDVKKILQDTATQFYDRDGEEHFNIASAFIKSLRGSDPDAALFWGFKMLSSGEDPRFIFRRLVIFASEDIGNADPRALQLAVAASEAFERVGLPEGRIPLAQCITYLASAPKSNRSYVAMHRAIAAVEEHPHTQVPMHLRNAPTSLMKGFGYGADYQYPHDNAEGFVRGARYLPDELQGAKFYEPSDHGLEAKIKESQQRLNGSQRK